MNRRSMGLPITIQKVKGYSGYLFVTSLYLGFLYTASAQDQWKLSLGTSYRGFDDIEFKTFNFRNFDDVDAAGGPFGIQNLGPTQPVLPDGQIRLESVGFTGSSAGVDFSDALSPIVVGVEALFDLGLRAGVQNTFAISIVSNLQYFDVEVSQSNRGDSVSSERFEGRQFNYRVVGGFIRVPPIDLDSPATGFAPDTSVTANHDLDMELYVLDLGVKPSFTTERLSCGVAVGATLNFIDIETIRTEQATFSTIPGAVDPAGNPTAGEYSRTREESESDVRLGAYAAFSLEVGILEHIGLAIEYRYDWIDDNEAATSQVALDLRGQSALVRAVYRF